MFEHIPIYDPYRTLSINMKNPLFPSEDVYALQSALNSLGFSVGDADGFIGPLTDKGIRAAQKNFFLVVDGLAGGKTQETLAMTIAGKVILVEHVPHSAVRGQLEHESGFRLGNYSPARPEGDFDAGVAQRNTAHTPAEEGFHPLLSIMALGVNTRKHYDLFAGVTPLKQRWMLAQGAWNAPAFACFIAREKGATKVTSRMTLRPTSEQRLTFEQYVAKVSKYL